MAAELENRCPICLDSWEEASYVLPCLHQFCYPCILRWAESKPECPLCKRRVLSILHSVRGDDDFQEHAIPPPAAPAVIIPVTGGAPRHLAAPAAFQPSAAVPRVPVGTLHPHVWASLLREDPGLFRPLLPWLRQELRLIFQGGRWEMAAVQGLVLSVLHLFGPDEETLIQLLQAALGPHTRTFVHRLINNVIRRCSREARRRVGLGAARDAEEREGSPAAAPSSAASQRGSPAPSPALGGGPGSPPPAPIPTHGEQEVLQEEPEEAVPGSSTASSGSQCSLGGLEFLGSSPRLFKR